MEEARKRYGVGFVGVDVVGLERLFFGLCDAWNEGGKEILRVAGLVDERLQLIAVYEGLVCGRGGA